MELTDRLVQIGVALFLAIFQLYGGLFFGAGLRRIFNRAPGTFIAILFGGMFGGAATLMDWFFLAPYNSSLFIIVILVFAGATVAAMLMPEWYGEQVGMGTIVITILGSFAVALGLLIGVGAIMRGEWGIAAVFGGCWTLIGWAFFASGLRALLRGKPLRFRSKSGGVAEITPAEDDPPVKKRARRAQDSKV